MTTSVFEINKWTDLYNDNGCPFDLAYMIQDPDNGYWRAKNQNMSQIYLDSYCTLLSEVLGYVGSYNFDDEDCLLILKQLYVGTDSLAGNNTLEKLTNLFVSNVLFQCGYVSDRLKHNIYLSTEKYVNTLLCLLDAKGLLDYGSCLQGCWISDKGKWIVLNRQLCSDRIKGIEANDI